MINEKCTLDFAKFCCQDLLLPVCTHGLTDGEQRTCEVCGRAWLWNKKECDWVSSTEYEE